MINKGEIIKITQSIHSEEDHTMGCSENCCLFGRLGIVVDVTNDHDGLLLVVCLVGLKKVHLFNNEFEII